MMFRYIGPIVGIAVLFSVVPESYLKGVNEQTQELLIQMTAGQAEDCQETKEGAIEAESRINTGVKFNCPVSIEQRTPTSVHELRPEDIDVVAAVGDSYTAAFGAGASYLGPVAFLEHRGLSFSIGGDESLETHVSLPNILEKYNPNVYGFSEGIGKGNSDLNVAVTGATSEDVELMIDRLVERFEDDPNVDMEGDWKLITLFIGGNDIFDSCLQPRFTPEYYKELMETALNTMKAMIPRALVSIMPMPDLVELKKLTGVVCDTVHLGMCPCLYVSDTQLEKLSQLSRDYSAVVEELAKSGDFDTDDFAIVYQPYISGIYVPETERGKPDYSFFAPDCLHLSRKGHASGGYHLWANMIEPVHAKTIMWSPTMGEYLPCPTNPYLYTNRNSAAAFQAKAGDFDANKQAKAEAPQHAAIGANAQDDTPNNSNTSPLSGGSITAIVFLVAILVVVAGYAVYRYKFKSRWAYQQI